MVKEARMGTDPGTLTKVQAHNGLTLSGTLLLPTDPALCSAISSLTPPSPWPPSRTSISLFFSWQESVHTSYRLQKQDWHISVEKVCKTLREGCMGAPTARTWGLRSCQALSGNQGQKSMVSCSGHWKVEELAPKHTATMDKCRHLQVLLYKQQMVFHTQSLWPLLHHLQKVPVKWMFLFGEKVLQCHIRSQPPGWSNRQLQDFQRKPCVATLNDLTKVSHHKESLLSRSCPSWGRWQRHRQKCEINVKVWSFKPSSWV